MAGIAIPDLDDEAERRLLVRAAANGPTVEEVARAILRDAVAGGPEPKDPAAIVRGFFWPHCGVDLELPPREPAREPPEFDRGIDVIYPWEAA